jgi:hypothetical protein
MTGRTIVARFKILQRSNCIDTPIAGKLLFR